MQELGLERRIIDCEWFEGFEMKEGLSAWIKAVSLGTSIPATFAGLVMGGFYLGRYLDRLLNTSPWLQLLLMFGGMVLSGFYFAYALKALGMTDDEK